jgi:hypothetical protein
LIPAARVPVSARALGQQQQQQRLLLLLTQLKRSWSAHPSVLADFICFVYQVDWQPASTDELLQTSAAAMPDWFTPEEDEAWQHLADLAEVK